MGVNLNYERDTMSDIVEQYLATWNANEEERGRLLEAHWSTLVTYVDPVADVSGRADLSALISSVQGQFPGFVFRQVTQADAHHRQLRFSWGLGPADQEPVVIGFDVVILDEDGRISDVRGFLDKVPE